MSDPITALRRLDAEDAEREQGIGGAGLSFAGGTPKLTVVEPAPEAFPDRPPSPASVALQEAVQKAAECEAKRQDALWRATSFARTCVRLMAMLRGQADGHSSPYDCQTEDSIALMLIGVYDAEPVDLPVAFRQASKPEDMAKSGLVAHAVGGTDGLV